MLSLHPGVAMEPLTIAAVRLDKTGRIVALQGAPGDFALSAEAVGRSWSETFAQWQLPFSLPADAVGCPFRAQGRCADGGAVTLEVLRPSAEDDGSLLVLITEADASAVPLKLQQLCGVGEIAAGVTHEINNALTILYGWLEVLRVDVGEQSPHRSTVELLLTEAQRIGTLTRNLHQVARGAVESAHELDLRRLLDEVVELTRPEMQKHMVTMETEFDAELPVIIGACGSLKQALLNLLINARQSMPRGGQVTLSARHGSNGCVRIGVQDTGCGIPPDLQRKIFRPFFTTKTDGTGLGLPITRRIVEDHGGTLELESAPGQGARFTLTLPVRGA